MHRELAGQNPTSSILFVVVAGGKTEVISILSFSSVTAVSSFDSAFRPPQGAIRHHGMGCLTTAALQLPWLSSDSELSTHKENSPFRKLFSFSRLMAQNSLPTSPMPAGTWPAPARSRQRPGSSALHKTKHPSAAPATQLTWSQCPSSTCEKPKSLRCREAKQ